MKIIADATFKNCYCLLRLNDLSLRDFSKADVAIEVVVAVTKGTSQISQISM
jgi:hypothetical protein